MAKPNDLRFGALGADYAHLCADMQRMFCEPTDWHTPWMAKILPAIEALVATRPKRTCSRALFPKTDLIPRSVAGGAIIGDGPE